ncbi:MAG: phosphoketolase family protein [Myxococcales bacterium FL481]|nr:MAG: phosphoketolase family protein [Myxococcales bacterium FL481]
MNGDQIQQIDAYWRAANYLSVGQIYLYDNPLLRVPLSPAHIKPRLLGHWGTTPGLNFIYAHLNRAIAERSLSCMFITGPGHGGPALLANTWLEGTYTQQYPDVTQDSDGMKRLFKQFSFPGGVPSHVAPETPGSIHEGGELGYALSHAYGAVFDNSNLVAICVVGDGEAETGPLATSWHSNKFISPDRDGTVLPILHLNGYKIANPSLLARISPGELDHLLRGYGHTPYYVEGDDPDVLHGKMMEVLDQVFDEIRRIRAHAATTGDTTRPSWPMIVLRTPKGWTGPAEVNGKRVEGSWRSHQVPLKKVRRDPDQLRLLESWMKSYRPEELFDSRGRISASVAATVPPPELRMGACLHTNGGKLLRDLRLPDYRSFAVTVPQPGETDAEATRVMGRYLADTMSRNREAANFRIFSPDENDSNRWRDVLSVTDRAWNASLVEGDDALSPHGRVMEMLSEHQCQGWLEGYLLTGRHGFFSCYEAFIHIVDSMFNQHAKWLKVCNEIPWRRPIASLNYLLSSHVWRQDHNGFSHQDPGFIDHVVNKKAEVVRVYLPPDANCLLWVTDQCLRSRNLINVVVAGKQPSPQWLTMDEAVKHCTAGLGIWSWASSDHDGEPDVVMACCGDVPTLETLAAVEFCREYLPELKVRVINVVNLMKLQPAEEHPEGLSHREFDILFTRDKPIIFAFHGYPWLIHRLAYRRTNHPNLHVRGYKEEGTTTTPFDMCVLNDIDRFHLFEDVIERVPHLGPRAAYAKQAVRDRLIEHREFISTHGADQPEIADWRWRAGGDRLAAGARHPISREPGAGASSGPPGPRRPGESALDRERTPQEEGRSASLARNRADETV